MTTIVINKIDSTGHLDEVYIGRGSKWGNPFSHVEGTKADHIVESREDAIAAYELWVQKQDDLMLALPELSGKILVCCCKPLACHGDVLARLVNEFDTAWNVFTDTQPNVALEWPPEIGE